MPVCVFTSGASSDMMSFATVLMSFWPCSIPVNRARLVLSQSCSWFLRVVSRKLRIISLTFSVRSPTSPCAPTSIVRVRSPLVTAVATSPIARICDVSCAASWLTESVRSRHRPAAPGTSAWPPSFPSNPTSRATDVT